MAGEILESNYFSLNAFAHSSLEVEICAYLFVAKQLTPYSHLNINISVNPAEFQCYPTTEQPY
jgi:hypothetical protein